MKSFLLKSTITTALVITTMTTFAEPSRCPANDSKCTIDNAGQKIRERVNEGKNKVVKNENPQGRVKEVGKTLRDCVRCGMDGIQDGMDKVTGKKKDSDDMD